MKYTEDRPEERFALVLSGDGKLEKRILASLAPKFDGESSSLFYPSVATKSSTTGLLPLLRGLKVAAEIHSRDEINALLLIDKEHIGDPTSISTTASTLGCGFEVVSTDSAFIHGILRFGPKSVITFIAVVGRERCAEEEVASLLNLKFGDSVTANKADINRSLNAHRTSLEGLLEGATINQLKETFVGICIALEALEHELSHISGLQN